CSTSLPSLTMGFAASDTQPLPPFVTQSQSELAGFQCSSVLSPRSTASPPARLTAPTAPLAAPVTSPGTVPSTLPAATSPGCSSRSTSNCSWVVSAPCAASPTASFLPPASSFTEPDTCPGSGRLPLPPSSNPDSAARVAAPNAAPSSYPITNEVAASSAGSAPNFSFAPSESRALPPSPPCMKGARL